MRSAVLLAAILAVSCTVGRVDPVDEVMRDYSGNVPGASVLVLRNGEVVARRSYGMADLENGIRATPATHYRLASVTKQFTAAAIVTLAERGQLSYDDSIRRFLPSLPSWADPITVRHLLTHTSGIIDYEDVIPEGTTMQLMDADVLRLLEQQTTTYFPAGTSYRYSNSGYALLALILERVSGRSFSDFLRDEIFLPLGMKTTVAHVEGISTVPDRAYGYSREGNSWKRTDQSLTSAVLGDGGIYTSIDDLVLWLRALEAGRFAAAMKPMVATDREGVRYGFGWRISAESVGHTGETIGFRNALVRFPDRKLAMVILTNRDEGHPADLIDSLRFSFPKENRP